MMIKLKCINEFCDYCFEVSEKEYRDNKHLYQICIICGSKLEVTKESLKEMVKKTLEQEIKERVDKYIAELGIEGTWELLERNKNYPMTKLFFDELRKRGINLK